MAAVNLTQDEREQLKANSSFRQFLVNSIFGPADNPGGISYFLGLSSFGSITLAKQYVVSLMIQTNPGIVTNDQGLIDFMMTRMLVRDLDKKDDAAGGDLLNQVKVFLNTSSNINFLVEDYLAEKYKPW